MKPAQRLHVGKPWLAVVAVQDGCPLDEGESRRGKGRGRSSLRLRARGWASRRPPSPGSQPYPPDPAALDGKGKLIGKFSWCTICPHLLWLCQQRWLLCAQGGCFPRLPLGLEQKWRRMDPVPTLGGGRAGPASRGPLVAMLWAPGAGSRRHILRPVTSGSRWLLATQRGFALVYVKAISRNKLLVSPCAAKKKKKKASSLRWAAAVLRWDAGSEPAKWSTGSSAESAWNIFLISQLLQHPVDGAVRWGTYACNTSFQQAHLVSLTLIFHCILPVTGVSYRLKQSPELPKRFPPPPRYSFCTRFCYRVRQMNQLEDSVSAKTLLQFRLFLSAVVAFVVLHHPDNFGPAAVFQTWYCPLCSLFC